MLNNVYNIKKIIVIKMMRNEYGETLLNNSNQNLFTQYGFETAEASTIMGKLQSITPSGNNSMNNAFIQSSFVLQDIYKATKTLTPSKRYEFVHVFLTASSDNCSKCNLEEASGSMFYLNQMFSTSLKTYLMGVNISNNQKAFQDLQTIKKVADENCYFMTGQGDQMDFAFEDLKKAFTATRVNDININYQNGTNYVVLFTIDYSMFMREINYNILIAIAGLIRTLAKDDLVGCIIYNDAITNVVKQVDPSINPYASVNNNPPQVNINVQSNAPQIVNPYSGPMIHGLDQHGYYAPQQVYMVNNRSSCSRDFVRYGIPIIFVVLSFIWAFFWIFIR
jgi:hypothetical protein